MFDRYVQQTRPDWRRRALAIASISLHVAAGLGLLVYSVFHVEEIAPPNVGVTFFSAPPPPPPPPPPAGKKRSAETPKVQPTKVVPTTEPKLVQPVEKPPEKKPEPEPEPESDDGEEGGEEGGEKGGVAGGVKGGVVGGTVGGVVGGTGDKPAAPPPPPKMVASFVIAAQQLSHPPPHLPDYFKDSHAGQTVKGTYKVCLREDGHVSDVTPMQGIPGMDAELASQIKSTWTYKPQPVPLCFVAALEFKIN
jgi:protein TonB